MKQPVLVVMAAGMGSRYGGLKQIDPVDDRGAYHHGLSLIYDAVRAGFRQGRLSSSRREHEAGFQRAAIGRCRLSKHLPVDVCISGSDEPSGGLSGSGRPRQSPGEQVMRS